MAYADLILAESSLQSYWPCTEASGNLADSKGSVTGTAQAGSLSFSYSQTPPTVDIPGGVKSNQTGAGGATRFDCGDVLDFAGTANFTIECWFKPTTSGNQSTQIIVGKMDGGLGRGWWLAWSAVTGIVETYRHDGTTAKAKDSTSTLSVGTWYHLAFTYDGSDQRLYINGALQSGWPFADTISLPGNALSLTLLNLNSTAYLPSNGTIAQVAVYNTALSATTLLAHATYTLMERSTSDALTFTDTQQVTAVGGYNMTTWAGDTLAFTDELKPYLRSASMTVVKAQPSGWALLSGSHTFPVGTISFKNLGTSFPSSGNVVVRTAGNPSDLGIVVSYTGKTGTGAPNSTGTLTGCTIPSGQTYTSGTWGDSSYVTISDAENHFPEMVAFDNPDWPGDATRPALLVVYGAHGGHGQAGGIPPDLIQSAAFKISRDGGNTWGAEGRLVPQGETWRSMGVTSLATLKDGSIFMTWYVGVDVDATPGVHSYSMRIDTTGTALTGATEIARPTDYAGGGSSDYTVYYVATGPGIWVDTSGGATNGTYGDIYITVYNEGFANCSKLLKSTDVGVTWTEVCNIATKTQTGGVANGEVSLTRRPDNRFLSLLRVESSPLSRWAELSNTTSLADGFGTPYYVADLANMAITSQSPDGTFMTIGEHSVSPFETRTYYSVDQGVTWGSSQYRTEAFGDGAWTEFNGGCFVPVAALAGAQRNVPFVYSNELGPQAGAQVYFRWFLDPSRRLADALAFTDVLARSAIAYARATADALTLTDIEPKTQAFARTTADALTFTDALARGAVANPRALTDALTFTQTTVAANGYNRTLSTGGLFPATFPSGSTFPSSGGVGDLLALSDGVIVTNKGWGRTTTDALTFTSPMVAQRGFTRVPLDAITFTDAIPRSSQGFTRATADALAFTDAIVAPTHLVADMFEGTVPSTDIYPGTNVLPGGGLVFTDTLAAGVVGGSRALTDTVTFAGGLITYSIGFTRALTDSITFTDDQTIHETGTGVQDGVVFTDELVVEKSLSSELVDTVTFTDAAVCIAGFVMYPQEEFNVSDGGWFGANTNRPRDLTDALTFTDTLDPSVSLNVAQDDALDLTDTIARGDVTQPRALEDTVTFSSAFAKSSQATARTLTDAITLTDVLVGGGQHVATTADALTFTDAMVAVGGAHSVDTLLFTDALSRQSLLYTRALTDTLGLGTVILVSGFATAQTTDSITFTMTLLAATTPIGQWGTSIGGHEHSGAGAGGHELVGASVGGRS